MTTFTSELMTLAKVSRTLATARDLPTGARRVLETLDRHHKFAPSHVALLDAATHELHLVATHGFKDARTRALNYKRGDGITGRVLQSNKPIIVPQVSREPSFNDQFELLKANGAGGRRRELSFICVPVALGRTAIGVLSVYLVYKPDYDFDHALALLSVVASMMAQARKIEHLIEADKKRLLDENTHLKQSLRERYDFSHIVGNSGPLRAVYEQVTQVARTNTTVLLRGESGTGKELIAHAIHYNSLRAGKPFVKVNCAALPETLIESELFGYERGAFTGAQNRKKGRFELADGGTLFLDEIGDLNASTQVKLLRALQEREFERLGGTETIKVNVRLIAATNKDLEAAIAAGEFREDLYYRLNVFAIFMPPLRERTSDVLLLADHFLEKYAREHGKPIKRISTPAIDMLASYHFPGNVRELENVIERAVLVCEGGVMHAHHLPPTLQTAEGSNTASHTPLADAVTAFERDMIQDAVKTTCGNCKKAAKLLGTTERIINYKIRKHAIDPHRFRR